MIKAVERVQDMDGPHRDLVRSDKRRQECLSIRANVLGCREDTGEDHRAGMAFSGR